MAISKTMAAVGTGKWMETAPSRKEYMGRRRPSGERRLLPIAEERSLSNGELMDGLQPAFPALCGSEMAGDHGRSACGES